MLGQWYWGALEEANAGGDDQGIVTYIRSAKKKFSTALKS